MPPEEPAVDEPDEDPLCVMLELDRLSGDRNEVCDGEVESFGEK